MPNRPKPKLIAVNPPCPPTTMHGRIHFGLPYLREGGLRKNQLPPSGDSAVRLPAWTWIQCTPMPARPFGALVPKVLLSTICLALILPFYGCNRSKTTQPPTREHSTDDHIGLAAEVAKLEAGEDELNRTLWAKEMLAQECGRSVERFWDQLNASTNRLSVAEEFRFDEIVLGAWKSSEKLPHGIDLRRSAEPEIPLSFLEWRQKLRTLAVS